MKEKLLGRCACTLLSSSFICFISIGKSWKISFVFLFTFNDLSRYWDESIVFPTTRGFLQKIDFPCSTKQLSFDLLARCGWKKEENWFICVFVEKKPVYKEAKLERKKKEASICVEAIFPDLETAPCFCTKIILDLICVKKTLQTSG